MNLFGLWRLNCSVCVSWTRSSALSRDSRGKYISPAPPHFLLCAGLSFPAGCALTARGGQLFTARFAGCGRGPSLRCVHLRRTCSSLPASAAAEPCSPFTSAARRIPRFFAGRQCCFVSHTRYYAQTVHIDRTSSGYCHHRDPGLDAAAGAESGACQSAGEQLYR